MSDRIYASLNTLKMFLNNLKNFMNDTYIPISEKGVANGVANLNENCTIPVEQLPDYLEIANMVRSMIWSDISGISTTRRNLAYNSAISPYALTGANEFGMKVSDYKWHVSLDSQYSGLQIDGSLFELGETYVLSYRFKKIDGVLEFIGGHRKGTELIAFYLDDALVTSNDDQFGDKTIVVDDAKEHRVELIIKITDLNEFTHIYIQPNRGSTTHIECYVWDIKLEKGTNATYWIPAPEDMTIADTIASIESRIATLEEKII